MKGIPGVPPGATLVLTAFDGKEARSRLVRTLPLH